MRRASRTRGARRKAISSKSACRRASRGYCVFRAASSSKGLRSATHFRPFVRHCERSEAIHRVTKRKNGLLRCARNDDLKHLPPGKYRLFQFGNAGIATCEHFTELVDQRRRRRVDELAGVTKPDHAPRAFGNGGEVERISPLDIAKRDTVDGRDLVGVG